MLLALTLVLLVPAPSSAFQSVGRQPVPEQGVQEFAFSFAQLPGVPLLKSIEDPLNGGTTPWSHSSQCERPEDALKMFNRIAPSISLRAQHQPLLLADLAVNHSPFSPFVSDTSHTHLPSPCLTNLSIMVLQKAVANPC